MDTVAGKTGGFTLLDMVLVIMILGILGVSVAPNIQGALQVMRVTEAAGEMASALQYARNLALRYGRPFGFQADAAGGWFKVYDRRFAADGSTRVSEDPPVTAYGVVLNPVDKNWYQRSLTQMQTYQGVTVTSAQIIFYPDGHAAALVPPTLTVTVQLGTVQRTVTVDEITGRVSVQ